MTTDLVHRVGLWNTKMSCFEDREYMERALVLAKKPIAIKDILASARRGGSPRISDRLFSYEGRAWRIHCERLLCEAVKGRPDIPDKWKSQLSSRIYALGFRTNAKGWLDLGKECGDLAESLGVKLDSQGRRRRLAWKMGKYGGLLYILFGRIKYVWKAESKRLMRNTRR